MFNDCVGSQHKQIQAYSEEISQGLPSSKFVVITHEHVFLAYQLSYFRNKQWNSDYFEVRAHKLLSYNKLTGALTCHDDNHGGDCNVISFSVNTTYRLNTLAPSLRDFGSVSSPLAVKLGPFGRIRMNPVGMGLGSILLSEAIRWLQLQEPYLELPVERLHLSVVDEEGDNKFRRNALYANAGFKIANGEGESTFKYACQHVRLLKVREDYELHSSLWCVVDKWVADHQFNVKQLNVAQEELSRLRSKVRFYSLSCAALTVLVVIGFLL